MNHDDSTRVGLHSASIVISRIHIMSTQDNYRGTAYPTVNVVFTFCATCLYFSIFYVARYIEYKINKHHYYYSAMLYSPPRPSADEAQHAQCDPLVQVAILDGDGYHQAAEDQHALVLHGADRMQIGCSGRAQRYTLLLTHGNVWSITRQYVGLLIYIYIHATPINKILYSPKNDRPIGYIA